MTSYRKQTVLLVVDMQNGFLGSRSRHVIPNVVKVVNEFKNRGLPILFTRFHNELNSPYEKLIGWKRLRTSPEIDLTAELVSFADLVFEKTSYSAFTPDLISMIERKGWETIVLCGVATDGCVLKTAVDAFERGLTPLVVADACASHAGLEIHNAGLLLLERFIGKHQIVNSEHIPQILDQPPEALR